MATVAEHYRTHLAPVYTWMAGGVDAAVARGESEIAAILPDLSAGGSAVDLGAGFGMHAIPLGRRGCTVLALDSCSLLLEQLMGQSTGLPVKAVLDEILSFRRHMDSAADAILCMGDTLTHLPDTESVLQLFALAAESLRPGGSFIATFRDYTSPLVGQARFIPVRSDAHRIMTCFLEYAPGTVDVSDLIHERTGSNWQLQVSVYRKLRLAPDWVSAALEERGLSVRTEPGLAGMIRVIGFKT
jgi:2-polyprenyl-3-methyl-5-hydroxy-6-metoxy-1,4-benzoquinol methylase